VPKLDPKVSLRFGVDAFASLDRPEALIGDGPTKVIVRLSASFPLGLGFRNIFIFHFPFCFGGGIGGGAMVAAVLVIAGVNEPGIGSVEENDVFAEAVNVGPRFD